MSCEVRFVLCLAWSARLKVPSHMDCDWASVCRISWRFAAYWSPLLTLCLFRQFWLIFSKVFDSEPVHVVISGFFPFCGPWLRLGLRQTYPLPPFFPGGRLQLGQNGFYCMVCWKVGSSYDQHSFPQCRRVFAKFATYICTVRSMPNSLHTAE